MIFSLFLYDIKKMQKFRKRDMKLSLRENVWASRAVQSGRY